jgi:hypothetical protein
MMIVSDIEEMSENVLYLPKSVINAGSAAMEKYKNALNQAQSFIKVFILLFML